MNVTLGVPRIKEIINASKTISSPIITVPLLSDKDVKSARIVKGRIEKTTLGEVAEYIEEFYSPNECYLSIRLDMNAIEKLQLNINAETVVRSILETKKLKLKSGVRSKGNDTIRIYPASQPGEDEDSVLYTLQKIKNGIPAVIVQGVPNVNRAVINDKGDGTFNLLVEGYNLLGVMTTLGVKGTETTSNHIMEVRGNKQQHKSRSTRSNTPPSTNLFALRIHTLVRVELQPFVGRSLENNESFCFNFY